MISKFFYKYFRSDSSETEKYFRFKIYVDKIKTKSKKSFNLIMNKNLTIKDLIQEISNYWDIFGDEIVPMIGGKIVNIECKLEEVVSDLMKEEETYIIRAVAISLEEKETINYDIEKYLREKYSAQNTPESDYIIMDKGYLEMNIIQEESAVCGHCFKMNLKDSMYSLYYCLHEICKDCLIDLIYRSLGDFIKCPQKECGRVLCDHEIQKILGVKEYKRWGEIVCRKRFSDVDFKVPKVGWICDSCTFLNKPYVTFCDACNGSIPNNYIIPSFYEPTDEEKMRKEKEEMEKEQQYIQKMNHLELLQNLARQAVTFTSETTECPVCMVDFEAGQAIILHGCLHTICRECLHNYLVNIENAHVKCPTENCVGVLEDQEIREILSESEFEKYQDLSLRMAEAKEELSFHCKTINCGGWIVHDGFLTNFQCPKCKLVNCIKCDTIHNDMSCEEYQRQKLTVPPDPNQIKNDLYIQSMIDSGNAMKCPGCKVIVEKNRGCDGVVCRNCGMMLCWATKGPRWGPKGKGDTSGGCGCRFFWGQRCHWSCRYCH